MFTRGGELIATTNRLLSEDNITYINLAPIFVKNNNYYCVIGYFNSNAYLQLNYFKISLLDYKYSLIVSKSVQKFRGAFLNWNTYNYQYNGLSCEYMIDDDDYEDYYLVCFLMVDKGGIEIVQDFYEIDESSLSEYHSYDYTEIKISNVKLIKSTTTKDISKSLVFVFIENDNMYTIKIYRYHFEVTSTYLDIFYEPQFKCAKKFYGIKTSYIYEKDIILFSCLGSNSVVQSVLIENSLVIK